MNVRKYIGITMLIAGGIVFAGGQPARAQVEIGGFGGISRFGSGGGSHALGGGNVGYNVGDNVQVFAEVAYLPLGSTNLFSGYGASADISSKLINFGGGASYIAGRSGSKARPYLLAAFGDGRSNVSASYTVAGQRVSASGSSNEAYAGVGGGIRLMAGEHWGFRPEVRYVRYVQSGGANVIQATVGVFVNLGK
jgi:hypothetical protein